MATRTISNTGGNYNATGTWVEAAVPTSADDVVATATSGQLTVNVASAAQSFNFTNYANTLTMNNTWTVSGARSNVFVSGMTISGASNIVMSGAGATISTNGLIIPNISLSNNKSLTDDFNCVNFTMTTAVTFTGNVNMFISGTANFGSFNTPVASGITCSVTGTGTLTSGVLAFRRFIINSNGTITLPSTGLGMAGQTFTVGLSYIQGTVSGTRFLRIAGGNTNQAFNLDIGSMSWSRINLRQNEAATSINTVQYNLESDVVANEVTVWGSNRSSVTIFSGSGALKDVDFNAHPWQQNNSGTIEFYAPEIRFSSGPTHSFKAFTISGLKPDVKALVRSMTASSTANIAITGTSSIQLTDFTDINADLGPFNVWRGTLTRTSGITNYTSFGGGISGGSFTFVN